MIDNRHHHRYHYELMEWTNGIKEEISIEKLIFLKKEKECCK